jgi:hypothetical protein
MVSPRIVIFLSVCAVAWAQAGQPLTFEIASVKPTPASDQETKWGPEPGGRFSARGVTLKQLIAVAYGVQEYQIAGGPKWMTADRWSIEAKAEGFRGRFNRVQPLQVMKALLVDRFQLRTHLRTKDMPVYALVQAKYSTIYASWSACNVQNIRSYNYRFCNYGNTHHSQYTLINESTCSGAQSRAYIITNLSSCFSTGLQTTTLESDFEAQVTLNGTGRRSDGTYLKGLNATSCRNATAGKPSDAGSGNTFVVVSSVMGSCHSPLDSSTVAQNSHQCGLQIYISGYGSPGTVKTVQDECPRCGNDPPHFDNWTDAGGTSCGLSVSDLAPSGHFVTAQVQQ